MDTKKAICSCKEMSEEDLIVAVQKGSFDFIGEWGIFVSLITLVLLLITGGFWAALVLGWHLGDIFNPGYVCNQCRTEVLSEQFRN